MKVILSGVASITLVLIGWSWIVLYPSIKSGKATGLAVLTGGLTEALYSPLGWLCGLLLFILFWYSGRLDSKILRVVLFWIPTVFVTIMASLLFALVMYAYTHRPNG
jgi:hypothetical protein